MTLCKKCLKAGKRLHKGRYARPEKRCPFLSHKITKEMIKDIKWKNNPD